MKRVGDTFKRKETAEQQVARIHGDSATTHSYLVMQSGKRTKRTPSELLQKGDKHFVMEEGHSSFKKLEAELAPYKKATERMARKELLLFAGILRSRICRGKPNKERQDNHGSTFIQKVEDNKEVFQSSANITGVTLESLKESATQSRSRRDAVHPTDEEIQKQAEECLDYVDLMENVMPHECALVKNFKWVQSNLFAQP